MTVLRSGGRITVMRLLRTKLKILIPGSSGNHSNLCCRVRTAAEKILVIEELETGNVYREIPVKTGDELSSGNIPLSIFHGTSITRYRKTGFILHTIAVAGFGAGIPAEMDCKYRYEDGLVYMDEIESVFPQFNWINSQTALKNIKVNGELLIQGSDMPHHVKMVLRIPEWF